MRSVAVRVDGLMVLTGALVAGAALLWVNRGRLADAVNPTKQENVVNQAAEGLGIATPDERNVTPADYVFAALDQINPFNADDTYSDFVIWGKEVAP